MTECEAALLRVVEAARKVIAQYKPHEIVDAEAELAAALDALPPAGAKSVGQPAIHAGAFHAGKAAFVARLPSAAFMVKEAPFEAALIDFLVAYSNALPASAEPGGWSPIEEPLASYLQGVVGLVEANSYEQLSVWKEYRSRGGVEQSHMGYSKTIACPAGRPIRLSFLTATLNGKKFCFWEATSQLVDHKLIDEWFDYHFQELPRVDAINFPNVFRLPPPPAQPEGDLK